MGFDTDYRSRCGRSGTLKTKSSAFDTHRRRMRNGP